MFIIPGSGYTAELYHSVYGPPASVSSSEQPNASEHNTGSTLTPSIPSVTRIPMSINNENTTHSFPANSITFGTNLSTAAISYGDLYRQVVQWESQNGSGSTPLGDSRLQFSNTGVQIPYQSEPMAPGSTDLSGSTSSSISNPPATTVVRRPAELDSEPPTLSQPIPSSASPQTPTPLKQPPLVSSVLMSYSARRHQKQGLPTEKDLSQFRQNRGTLSGASGSQRPKKSAQPARQDSSDSQLWSAQQTMAVQLMKEHYHVFILTESSWPTPTEFNTAIEDARKYANSQTGFDFSPVGIDLHDGFDAWVRKQEPKLRGDPKPVVRAAVENAYGVSIVTLPRINSLLAQRAYTFEHPETRQGSFRHPGIAAVLEAAFFKGKSSIGHRFMATKFSPQMPLPTIAFACVLIQNSLEDIRAESIGITEHQKRAKSLKFDGATYRPFYLEILERLRKYEKDRPERCRVLQEELTERCKVRCQWGPSGNEQSGSMSDEFLNEPWSEP